jgi:hypothetical protein
MYVTCNDDSFVNKAGGICANFGCTMDMWPGGAVQYVTCNAAAAGSHREEGGFCVSCNSHDASGVFWDNTQACDSMHALCVNGNDNAFAVNKAGGICANFDATMAGGAVQYVTCNDDEIFDLVSKEGGNASFWRAKTCTVDGTLTDTITDWLANSAGGGIDLAQVEVNIDVTLELNGADTFISIDVANGEKAGDFTITDFYTLGGGSGFNGTDTFISVTAASGWDGSTAQDFFRGIIQIPYKGLSDGSASPNGGSEMS